MFRYTYTIFRLLGWIESWLQTWRRYTIYIETYIITYLKHFGLFVGDQ